MYEHISYRRWALHVAELTGWDDKSDTSFRTHPESPLGRLLDHPGSCKERGKQGRLSTQQHPRDFSSNQLCDQLSTLSRILSWPPKMLSYGILRRRPHEKEES